MIINDKIYGKIKITEPVLVALLKSPSVLRLKNISQFGVPDKYYHLKNFSRYEHSVGVMILLRKLGATLEEQAAGLLHDVSVLAFSHVADWVFADGRGGIEDYHDSIHEKFIKRIEIPKILERFNLVLEKIINENNFSLLERKAPDLCADRIDYGLREFKNWLNPKIVNNCIKGLINFNGEIVFSDQKAAFDFAANYLKLQTQHWGGYQAMMRYHLFSQALKIALDKKILSEKDFYKDEQFVLGKFEKIQDETMEKISQMLRNKELKGAKCVLGNLGKKIVKKFRYVDPKIISNGRLIKLSELVPEFQTIIDRHREINRRGLFV